MFLALDFLHFFVRADGDILCSKVSIVFADGLAKYYPFLQAFTTTDFCQNVDFLLLDVIGFKY